MRKTIFGGFLAAMILIGGAAWFGSGLSSERFAHSPEFPDYVEQGLAWVVAAQHENGGWGTGSHANQQLRDPHQVETDPATTAFSAMALMRAGNTPSSGKYADAMRRATEYLVTVVEEYPAEGPRITDLEGTQTQVKMGHLVDTSMAVLFFSRLLPHMERGRLRSRVDAALDKCLVKLQGSQTENGAWDQAGWAGVLQSSIGCSALEFARAAGKKVDEEVLAGARDYHRSNFNMSTGTASGADGAGVELYAYSSSRRAVAGQAKAAQDLIDDAKEKGELEKDAPVSIESLKQIGVAETKAAPLLDAYKQAEAQVERLDDESMLSGFGNNGGEEYLSYMLTSESLVITGGEAWEKWNATMQERLAKIQRDDGSWTGLHCITGPVFCTSAVLQCLTAGEDADLLATISTNDVDFSRE
jgi:hypothetical protein